MPQRIDVLGIPIDVLTLPQTVARIARFVSDGGLHLVVTANPEIIEHATRKPAMRRLLQSADLCTADGHGVLLGARILGKALPERVTGIELAEAICAQSGRQGWRIYFLGSEPGVVDEAVRNLQARYPDLLLAGCHHGFFRDGGENDVIEDIRASKADVLLAGLGSPYQEMFIQRYQWEMQVPVGIGVGGSFDVFSGRVQRAPAWVRRLRLEWLYRIAGDPKRWRRAMALPRFVFKVLKERFTGKMA